MQQKLEIRARREGVFDRSRPRPVMFIVDRSFDVVAPLIHEFFYQAMLNDLMEVENGTKVK